MKKKSKIFCGNKTRDVLIVASYAKEMMSNHWTDDVVTRGVTRISHNFEITEPDGEQEMIRLLLRPAHSNHLVKNVRF